MVKRTDLRRIMIIGAGPIVIGQACEFDYSGSQACRALMEEGYEVILVNSNPATIMTDPDMATRTYIEPITVEVVSAIIKKEKPDAILPTMGGQTALNISFELYRKGFLKEHNVELIGANFNAIQTAEDREAFKIMVGSVGLETLRSETVTNYEDALKGAYMLGYPLIIRPAFTLGGLGGSVVNSEEELQSLVEHGLNISPINQILMEESALGWKEYEFEVMRDSKDNVVIVCSVENVDPMGIHTGDSITVAPAQTLSDKEYHILRNASINIIRAVGVDAGGCNIQFAVHPDTGRVVVIEMNPRVSRSSALVSKATGVPIAKISAKLAIGLTLDEIPNDITKTTPACFEPAIDYVVTKIPRFSFEKFPGTKTELSPQMKSVGEVMAIGRTFQESFQKALRGLEIGLDGFNFPLLKMDQADLIKKLSRPSSDRLRWIYQALHESVPILEIHNLTGIDPWFLENFRELIISERSLEHIPVSDIPSNLLRKVKQQGFSDVQIAKLVAPSRTALDHVQERLKLLDIKPIFRAVDTCAGEFEAYTPYFYSTYDGKENEVSVGRVDNWVHEDADSRKEQRRQGVYTEINDAAEQRIDEEYAPQGPKCQHALTTPSNKRVVILGGGPNRIGQGIEFDYCCVHAAFTLRELGYQAIMVNSNPETVSTDYDISDRLYFEPLDSESVLNILKLEQPKGVIVQLGGQTPLKLSQILRERAIPILGTSAESIDLAEDRNKFGKLLSDLDLRSPESGIACSEREALDVAKEIGYPLIARPSYILGGQSMRIFYSERSLKSYLSQVIRVEPDYPVLIERYLEAAKELDVDAVSDSTNTMVGAILEHIEHAGVHSGDSYCVWPPQRISSLLSDEIIDITKQLATALDVKGLLNIQFAIRDDKPYVLEVNPRASRTVPFVCKATGIPLIRMATSIMLGESLEEVTSKIPKVNHVAVKAPVFPFNKFHGSDPKLGPEMRSTGEVMGLDSSFAIAFAKAQVGAGNRLPISGKVFISINDSDKPQALEVAHLYHDLGFTLIATSGTANFLRTHGKLPVTVINKKHEGSPNPEELISSGDVQLVINTPAGEEALIDDSYIRKATITYNIPYAATITVAKAIAEAIYALRNHSFTVKSLQEYLQQEVSSSLV